MKSRKQVLISAHDAILGQLVEKEINFISLSRKAIIIKSGKDHVTIQKKLAETKGIMENIKGVLIIIEELIMKEENGKEVQPN